MTLADLNLTRPSLCLCHSQDASKYPALIAELISRGWSDSEITGLTQSNILRIIEKVEAVAHKLRHAPPETEIFEGRTDMERREW